MEYLKKTLIHCYKGPQGNTCDDCYNSFKTMKKCKVCEKILKITEQHNYLELTMKNFDFKDQEDLNIQLDKLRILLDFYSSTILKSNVRFHKIPKNMRDDFHNMHLKIDCFRNLYKEQ